MIRFRPLLGPTLWFIPGLLLLVGLGVWQIERLQEKAALIAAVNTRVQAPPIPIEQALQMRLQEAEWRHVSLGGTPIPDHNAFFFAAGPHGEPGVQVITPFELAGGGVILVNRGFVPESVRADFDRAERGISNPPQAIVTGILRLTVPPGLFTPKPDVNRRLWFSKDANAIAQAFGISLAAPVFVEADAGSGSSTYPLGGQTIVDFPNDHLQYAITWFGLALALTAVYLFYHRSRARLRFG